MNPTHETSQSPAQPEAGRESYTYPRLQVPLFGSEYLEYTRRLLFSRHPDYLPMLVRLLDIHPGMTVVDVGCGSGFYTRLMASRLQGEGHVIGIDPGAAMLTQARQITQTEGWSEIILYYQGPPTALPAPDGATDLVFGNAVLWMLPAEQRAQSVHEMLRITRKGGRAIVAEPDGGFVHIYDPQRPRLQELEDRVHDAFVRGTAQLDGYDYDLARKLPALFQQAGFERVRMYPRLFVVAGCDLGPDPKQGLIDRVTEYQQALAALIADTAEAKARREHHATRLRAGGLTDEEYAEHQRLTIERLRDLTEHPEHIVNDASVYTYGGLFCEGYHV